MTSADHRDRYNSLPSVFAASTLLKEHPDFMAILQQLGSIISSAKLEKFLTIRLLHNHHTLSDGEAMVQRLESFNGAPCLATVKVVQAEITEHCTPAIWRCLGDGQIEPLEFGYASLYPIPEDFYQRHQPVFARFAKMAEKFGLSGVLGLGLRSHALDFDPACEVLAEFTGDDRDILIKCAVNDLIGLPESVDTAWSGGEAWPWTRCHSCVKSSDDPQTGLPRHSREDWMHERRKDEKEDKKDGDTTKSKN